MTDETVSPAEILRATAPELYEALAALVAVHDRDTALVGSVSNRYRTTCWARARRALEAARAGLPDRKPSP